MRFVAPVCLAAALAISANATAQPQRPRFYKNSAAPKTPAEFKRAVEQLSSAEPRVRAGAAIALGKLGEDAKDAVPELIR